VHRGVADKAGRLEEIAAAEDIPLSATLYMGDDLPDLPAMALAGVAATVADAPQEVLDRALLITERPGGHGAVREVAELVLRSRGRWDEIFGDEGGTA
jgi:3-deoxy-D-manno-octulosonate 8-phosphate phosphatase (KDO 8-P phosphatase)